MSQEKKGLNKQVIIWTIIAVALFSLWFFTR